jgi:hypothetical protein
VADRDAEWERCAGKSVAANAKPTTAKIAVADSILTWSRRAWRTWLSGKVLRLYFKEIVFADVTFATGVPDRANCG